MAELPAFQAGDNGIVTHTRYSLNEGEMVFKRADQLREGDKVRVFDWVGDSIVTAIEGPFKPHVRNATRSINLPSRECVRVQLDHLSWILWDVDFEVEVYD